MSKALSIRGGLAATIAGYTTLLMLVIAGAVALLFAGRADLFAMYRDDTASLLHLKTSSERLLVLRGGLGEVEQLISAGQPAKKEIARLHELLAQSNDELAVFRQLHVPDAAEKDLLDTLLARRQALFDQTLQKALSELDSDNMVDFLSTQREASPATFAAYQDAIAALENLQVAREKARFDEADARFQRALWMLGAAALIAVIVGFLMQRRLARAIVTPVNSAVDHFDRISKGDLTRSVVVGRANEMGHLLKRLGQMQAGLAHTVGQVRTSTEAIMADVQNRSMHRSRIWSKRCSVTRRWRKRRRLRPFHSRTKASDSMRRSPVSNCLRPHTDVRIPSPRRFGSIGAGTVLFYLDTAARAVRSTRIARGTSWRPGPFLCPHLTVLINSC